MEGWIEMNEKEGAAREGMFSSQLVSAASEWREEREKSIDVAGMACTCHHEEEGINTCSCPLHLPKEECKAQNESIFHGQHFHNVSPQEAKKCRGICAQDGRATSILQASLTCRPGARYSLNDLNGMSEWNGMNWNDSNELTII